MNSELQAQTDAVVKAIMHLDSSLLTLHRDMLVITAMITFIFLLMCWESHR